jgi:hypothetical protein
VSGRVLCVGVRVFWLGVYWSVACCVWVVWDGCEAVVVWDGYGKAVRVCLEGVYCEVVVLDDCEVVLGV